MTVAELKKDIALLDETFDCVVGREVIKLPN